MNSWTCAATQVSGWFWRSGAALSRPSIASACAGALGQSILDTKRLLFQRLRPNLIPHLHIAQHVRLRALYCESHVCNCRWGPWRWRLARLARAPRATTGASQHKPTALRDRSRSDTHGTSAYQRATAHRDLGDRRRRADSPARRELSVEHYVVIVFLVSLGRTGHVNHSLLAAKQTIGPRPTSWKTPRVVTASSSLSIPS